jgi:hypothetical protein
MPISKYFKGHGEDVMKSIRKAHPDWSEKRVKSEFYATASKKNAKPGQHMEVVEPQGKSRSSSRKGVRIDTYES